jgi:exodeoxyribonuclease V alpha subunit
LAAENSIELTDQQQGAVKAALTNKVSVLTGGPGTGKTTTLRMVIRALEDLDFTFALASPTGRAAKRLSEATEHPASTIHRLLGYVPGEGFVYDEDNPLDVDMLIVDETSMLDLLLFFDLLKALRPETHLMLVGDVDQLPSVGAGNVLRDVINSGVAHVTRLKVIFRQNEASHIVVNAHRINAGDAPFMDNNSADFYFFGKEDPVEAAELLVDIVNKRLPEKFGVDPIEDVQVIAPMYRGPIGVHALNEALQKTLNGDKRLAEKQLGGRTFRAGDKVMQTRNNYDKEVFNGDIGRIQGIDFDDASMEVVFDGRYVYYEFSEAEELIHAYCISTHRSQGSEYPVVVMPLMTQHYMMLQRNLLYTAVTRAKKLVVLVGSRKAVHMAVQNNKVAERYSGLLQRLRA